MDWVWTQAQQVIRMGGDVLRHEIGMGWAWAWVEHRHGIGMGMRWDGH